MAVRLSPKWFTALDDRILEYLQSEGRAAPKMIADDGRIGYHQKYIGRRLRKLADADPPLVQRVGRGFYQLTPVGVEYLSGEADLRDLPEPE